MKYRSTIFHQEENKILNWFGRHFPYNAPGIHCAKKGILINCRHLVDLSVCVAWSCSESKNEAAVIWMEKVSHLRLLRVNTFIWLASSSRPVFNSWLSVYSVPAVFEHWRLVDEACWQLMKKLWRHTVDSLTTKSHGVTISPRHWRYIFSCL